MSDYQKALDQLPDYLRKSADSFVSDIQSGKHKKWTMQNSGEPFNPLQDFNERTDALFDSPVMHELEEKLSKLD